MGLFEYSNFYFVKVGDRLYTIEKTMLMNRILKCLFFYAVYFEKKAVC